MPLDAGPHSTPEWPQTNPGTRTGRWGVHTDSRSLHYRRIPDSLVRPHWGLRTRVDSGRDEVVVDSPRTWRVRSGGQVLVESVSLSLTGAAVTRPSCLHLGHILPSSPTGPTPYLSHSSPTFIFVVCVPFHRSGPLTPKLRPPSRTHSRTGCDCRTSRPLVAGPSSPTQTFFSRVSAEWAGVP